MTSIVLGLWGDGTWQKEKVKTSEDSSLDV